MQDPELACRHPALNERRAAREGERIAGTLLPMSSNIDLRLSPFCADLYGILDVLAAIGFDLARSSQEESITRTLHGHMMRDRQGLELVGRMLKEFAARHGQDGPGGIDGEALLTRDAEGSAVDKRTKAMEGIVTAFQTNVVASSR